MIKELIKKNDLNFYYYDIDDYILLIDSIQNSSLIYERINFKLDVGYSNAYERPMPLDSLFQLVKRQVEIDTAIDVTYEKKIYFSKVFFNQDSSVYSKRISERIYTPAFKSINDTETILAIEEVHYTNDGFGYIIKYRIPNKLGWKEDDLLQCLINSDPILTID